MEFIYILLIVIAVLLSGLSTTMMTAAKYETERLVKCINDKTKFFCKKAPGVTCIIDSINWEDAANARIKLTVTYPSGNTCSLLTTTGVFNEIWMQL